MAQVNIEQNQSSPANQGMPGPLRRSQFRQLSYLGLLAGLVMFAILIAWAVFRFSLPKPGSITVGTVQDFQSVHEPRLFWLDSTPFYVVKSGDEIIALSAYSISGRKPCFAKWDLKKESFVDPCWGTRFDIHGDYQFGPPAELTRLPVRIVDGEVWVEVWKP